LFFYLKQFVIMADYRTPAPLKIKTFGKKRPQPVGPAAIERAERTALDPKPSFAAAGGNNDDALRHLDHQDGRAVEFSLIFEALWLELDLQPAGFRVWVRRPSFPWIQMTKRLADAYDPRIRWLTVKNPDYSQQGGRGDLFNPPARRQKF